MKSLATELLAVAECILLDASAKCAVNNLGRDSKTIRSRLEDEGLSFLTITLPAFGKDFERSLALGRIEPEFFRSFRKYLKAPAFLRGFFALIFDLRTGRLLDDPKIEAIESIRQIAYAFKKLELECTSRRKRDAIREFQQCEHDLEETLDQDDIDDFFNVSCHLWDNCFSSWSFPASIALIPKHGPGATEEHATGNRKYAFKRWHERLEPYFPLFHFAFSSESAWGSKEFERVSLVSSEDEAPVRVHLVPKTLKAPRVIAIEPVCMQYTQQALSQEIIRTLEGYRVTAGHINFRDQQVNRSLAISSSKDGKLATLDLSSASDRVPVTLALSMFRSNPDLQGAIFACRSKNARLPNGDVMPLRKFASMGSALCFPIEAMYFYTCCVVALIRKRGLPVTPFSVLSAAKDVYVYGDDIIVPADDAAMVIETMQKFYCKVNTAKSFWTGKFRESCGMDAYDGEEVTPTYIKHAPPNDQRDTTELVSWVKSSNLLYKRGYWRTSDYLLKRCEVIFGALPIMGPDAGGLGKVSFQHLVSVERWNCRYQIPEVRAWVVSPIYHPDRLGGYHALSKCLLELERKTLGLETEQDRLIADGYAAQEVCSMSSQHLERSVLRGAVALKRRWIRPY